MRTVIVGEHPELDALIARRRASGADTHDEVWDGEYHMAPAAHRRHGRLEAELIAALRESVRSHGLALSGPVNLGEEQNYRVPDIAVHRPGPDLLWNPTAAMVVEVVSPHDESWLKFDHYAAHGVDEVLIADPQDSTLHLFVLVDGSYQPADASLLLGITVADLHAAIEWPGAT